MQIPRRKSEELRRKDGGPVYLTEEGFTHLQEKLVKLKRTIPALASEAGRAADYGDRSENAEYKEAKAILRRTQGQILRIEDQMRLAVIIASGPNTSGIVELGSTVVVEVSGTEKTFQILGTRETNPDKGRISHESPLGLALMHHKKGDVVTVETPRGPRAYRILEIK